MARLPIEDIAADFGRALVMPNLTPPVTTTAEAVAYRDRILAALPEGMAFTPLMTLYLTEDTDPEDVARAAESGLVTAVKLYPAGATTNSASGVRDFDKVRGVLERTLGIPIFQEQVIKLAMVAAGFTPGEADRLRRSMAAWRRHGQILEFEQRLVDGMRARGYPEQFARQLFKQILGFGEYGDDYVRFALIENPMRVNQAIRGIRKIM